MILVFVNPFSGAGRTRQRVDALVQALQENHQLQAQIIESLDQRRELLADPTLPDRCTCLVAAGGDGTANAIVNELHEDSLGRIPVAILSAGNENLLARELGLLQTTPQELAAFIAKNNRRRIDLGVASGGTDLPRKFILMASAGLDSDVVGRVEAWRKLPQGLRRVKRSSYLSPILSGILGYHYRPVRLTADGQSFVGAHVLVFNINRYAGGLSFALHTKTDDGKLGFLVLKRPGKINAIRYLGMILLGHHHKSKDVHTGTAVRLRIEADPPLPVQADGDTIGHTPMDLHVLPGAVDLIVPD